MQGEGKGAAPPPANIGAKQSKGGGQTYAEKQQNAAQQQMDEHAAPQNFADKPWQERLNPQEAKILNEAATEYAGTGVYNKFYPTEGYFACKKCGVPIYSCKAKFDSGCGWPAFDKCYKNSIKTVEEDDGRTEIRCNGCDAHLGHVFGERGHAGQRGDSGERHCANSLALQFVKAKVDQEEETVMKRSRQ